MNRRSVLRWLGLAPVAAPAAVAAASAPTLPPIDYSAMAADVIERTNAAAAMFQPLTFDLSHPTLPSGSARITSEMTARTVADSEQASFVGAVFSRPL